MTNTCKHCAATFPAARAELGYTTCLPCGDSAAKQVRAGWCVAQEYTKGNYQLITNLEALKQANPRRTT